MDDDSIGYGDPLSDYFYNFDEAIDAQYLYYNRYVTRAANTFTNMDPYLDTLNFSTFPSYTVEIENQIDTVGYQLSITTDNIDGKILVKGIISQKETIYLKLNGRYKIK